MSIYTTPPDNSGGAAVNVNITGSTPQLNEEATQLNVLGALDSIESGVSGLATQTTLAALLAAFGTPGGGAASQTTLAAVLTALSGIATQTTLAAILAALGTEPNQEATQLNVLSALDSIESSVAPAGGLATQTTLASLLSNIGTPLGGVADHTTLTQIQTEIASSNAILPLILQLAQPYSFTFPFSTAVSSASQTLSATGSKYFSLGINANGTITSLAGGLQFSNDGTNWTTVAAFNFTGASLNTLIQDPTPHAALFLRVNVTSVVLGTATLINAIICGRV